MYSDFKMSWLMRAVLDVNPTVAMRLRLVCVAVIAFGIQQFYALLRRGCKLVKALMPGLGSSDKLMCNNSSSRLAALRPQALTVLRPDSEASCTSPAHTVAYRDRLRLISEVPVFRRVQLADYPLLARAMARESWPANSVVQIGGEHVGSLRVVVSGYAQMEQEQGTLAVRADSCGSLTREGSQYIFLQSSMNVLRRGDYFGLHSSRCNDSKFPVVRAGSRGLVVLSLPFKRLEELGVQTCRQKHARKICSGMSKRLGNQQWLLSALSAELGQSFNLSKCQLEQLAQGCNAQRADEGEVLLERGKHDEVFYLVESGTLCAVQPLVSNLVKAVNMESAQEVTKPSTPFPEFSPCKNAFEFFASHECVDAMSPPRSTRTVRTPTSIKSLHNTSDSSKRFFGPGEVVGLIEAFFGAPNTITLTAHAPSLVWACPRAVIQSALYSSAISATEMKPIIKTALGKDLEERAKRNVLQQDVPLLKDLQHVRDIGNGSYGSVSLVRDTGTNGKDRMYAMKKIVRKSMVNKVQRQLVRNEREVMGIMDSKFIVHLHATYRDANNLYFLMEPALGGDMFTFMHKQRESLNDVEAFVRYASASVALALQHMHARKVIYRDLKPENVLVTCEGCLKVCDFGLSKLCVTMAQTMCGTPEYVAPEVLNHEGYTHMVDWWALGVFIYELFSDQVPFQADDFEVLSRKIRHGISSARFPRQIFSPIAESVVQALCNSDASRRLCASHGLKELCCHPFFMDFAWHDLASGTMEPPFTPPLTPISKCEALVTCSNVISP